MRFLLAAFLVLLFLVCIATPFVAYATVSGHGCAPPIPPTIPGNPTPVPASVGIIVINEVLLVPHSTWNCSESGTYFTTTDSWVELYNPQNQPFNLYAAHTEIDSGPNTNAFYLPSGASIAAHGYLVVFPRTSSAFVLTETATMRLIIPNAIADQITIPTLGQDQSYARTSDGAPSWQITSTPTIDASNTSLQATPPATPTATKDKQRSSSGGSGSSTQKNKSILANGNQPQWSNLQLPAVTPTMTLNNLPASVSTTSTGNMVLDVGRRILLSILCVALAFTLFWGWRIYRKS